MPIDPDPLVCSNIQAIPLGIQIVWFGRTLALSSVRILGTQVEDNHGNWSDISDSSRAQVVVTIDKAWGSGIGARVLAEYVAKHFGPKHQSRLLDEA